MKTGLDNALMSETRLSSIDGQQGELVIAGFPLQTLAMRATFEETVYLLWHDKLPNATELASFKQTLIQFRQIPQLTLSLLRQAAEQKLSVIEALRLGIDSLSLSLDTEDSKVTATAILAVTPCIVASYYRLLNGLDIIAARDDLGHAANFLYMLRGQLASENQVKALEVYLNTTAEHGLNASTFTAMVIAATRSDFLSAIVGAIGALKGPLHGGAPGPALDMVFEIGHEANITSYLTQKLEAGERLMGFGHRVYKTRDPRADVLAQAAKALYADDSDQYHTYALAMAVEQEALRLLQQYKPGRKLYTNVEFYTALVLHGIGLETDIFTPIFTISRTAGWLAHCFEQVETGRLIRPKSAYVGVKNRQWPVSLEKE